MTIRVECLGAQVGVLWLPPFTCQDGEVLCLHFPKGGIEDGYRLPKFLTGQTQINGLKINGPAQYAERPVPQRYFLGFLHNPRLDSWLRRQGGLTAEEANSLIERRGTRPETRIGRLDWTTRSLIALDAALSGPAKLIVFETSGLDPVGIKAMCDLVERRRADRAVIHVTALPPHQGLCFPGARCIEVGLVGKEVPASGAA